VKVPPAHLAIRLALATTMGFSSLASLVPAAWSQVDPEVSAGAPSGRITLGTPNVRVPVRISRDAASPAILGFSVVFRANAPLVLPAGRSSITLPPGGGFLNADGGRNVVLQTIDQGGGVYRADGVTLGSPCGSTALTGTLFEVELSSAALAGSPTVDILGVTLRDCVNTPIPSSVGASSTVIINRSAPSVSVTSPNGGEILAIGSTHAVTWTANDPEGVTGIDLAYSLDGGATYPHSIATGLANSGSHAWLVPSTLSSSARVRVTARDPDDNQASDASDADFSIACPTITVTAAPTHVACHGGMSGAIDLSVSGGTAPYSFQWGDGPTSEDRGGLAAGSYPVTVTDANGCPGSLEVTVSEPALLVAAETHTDACLTAADGTIDVSVSGGTPPYGYLWSDGPTSEDRGGLAPGSYSLTVTDANGCTANVGATIGIRSSTITASAGANGSIAPAGAVLVACGADQSFTVTADPGHHVLDVVVDAVSQGPQSAWTFTNVQGDHTIAATFEANPPVAPLANLVAAQVRTGNTDGPTTRITLTWDPTPSGTTVEVWRAPFGQYPLYDDAGGVPPLVVPTYPPGAPWVLTGVTTPGSTDHPPARDFYYYVAYVRDGFGTWSIPSNRTAGTLNYHLGDVSNGITAGTGNNQVITEDISLLGAHYGVSGAGLASFRYLDVGPTTTGFLHGRPTTDGQTNFEDLVMFALNFAQVSAPGEVEEPPRAGGGGDAMDLDAPGRVAAGESVAARLALRGSGALRALAMRLEWDPAVVEPVGHEAGTWLALQGGVAFAPAPGAVDAAVFGAAGMSGEGEIAVVTFRALAAGDPRIRIASADGRDARNQPVEVVLPAVPALPAIPRITQLAASRPNPFLERATISFSLATPGPVNLAVYSVDGRRVRMLVRDVREAGEYSVTWDGRDDGGAAAAPGVYWVQLVTAQQRFARSATYLR
jgi:hypothetical protein